MSSKSNLPRQTAASAAASFPSFPPPPSEWVTNELQTKSDNLTNPSSLPQVGFRPSTQENLISRYTNFLRTKTQNPYLLFNPVTYEIKSRLELDANAIGRVVPYFLWYHNGDAGKIGPILQKIQDYMSLNRCTNKDVDQNDPGLVRHDSYCFTRDQLPQMFQYQTNPYTGRPLPEKFLKDTFFYRGDYLTPSCTPCDAEPCKTDLDLTTQTFEWLKAFMRGEFMQSPTPYQIPGSVREELSHFKRCGPIKVYRGFHFGRFNVQDLGLFLPLTLGKQIEFPSTKLSSWTTDKTVSNKFERASKYGFTVEVTVFPQDILMDTNLLKLSDRSRIDVEEQAEVILLPGTYKAKVVSLSSTMTVLNNPQIYDSIVLIAAFLVDNHSLIETGCNYQNLRYRGDPDFLTCNNKQIRFSFSDDLTLVHLTNLTRTPIQLFIDDYVVEISGNDTHTIMFSTPGEAVQFVYSNMVGILSVLSNLTW